MHWPSLKASAILFQKYLISLFSPFELFKLVVVIWCRTIEKYTPFCVFTYKNLWSAKFLEDFLEDFFNSYFLFWEGAFPETKGTMCDMINFKRPIEAPFNTTPTTQQTHGSNHAALYLLAFVSLICYAELKFLYTNHWLAYKTYHWLPLVVQCKYKGALGLLG